MIVCRAIVMVAWVWMSLAAVAAPTEIAALPLDSTSELQDRTRLQAQGRELVEALGDVSAFTLDDLRAASVTHAAQRLETVRTASGQPRRELVVYDDLMRFPEPNRGQAVSLSGIVRQSEQVLLYGTEVQLITATSIGDTTAIVQLLTPANTPVPVPGARVDLIGLFAKLVESGGSDASTRVAPLLLAPAVATAVQPREGPEPAQWSVVRHRTLGVRPAEKELYYQVLQQAAQADPQALEVAARDQLEQRKQNAPARLRKQVPFPTFVDLFKHPEAYEGKPVTLKGHAREVRKYPAGDNAEGIDTLYEAWVYTEDSESNPAVIVASSASADLPIGDDLQVPVEATGYFFKIYAYHAHDTARVAPMVLAGKIEKLPEPTFGGPPIWLLIAVGAVAALLVGWLVVSYFGTRRRRVAKVDDASPDFSAVLEVEGKSG